MVDNSRVLRAQLLKELNQYRGTAELQMMRRFLELELEDSKDKLVGASAHDLPALQGGARVLRFLTGLLTNPMSDIAPKAENTNG